LPTSEFFHYAGGELSCEEVPLAGLAGRFGTPAYVYSQSAVLGNFQRVRAALEGLPALICYSVKANSNLRILELLRGAGAGFDVVSGGELARVLRVRAAPHTIVFSGVGKTKEEIDAGLAAGVLMFNLESRGELESIESRARALGSVAPISVRVNPDIDAHTHPYISTGQAFHKFGVPRAEALDLCRHAARSPYLKVQGVACHIGSQILEAGPFERAFEAILEVSQALTAEGINVRTLDLGGGYGISYAGEQPLDVRGLARALTRSLTSAARRVAAPPAFPQLILEPGRALVGDAGALLTSVLYLKRSPSKNFVIVDAGMNDLIRPALYDAYHEIVPVRQRAGGHWRADIAGPVCESTDFLAQDRDLPEVEPGDLLAVLTAGAYGFVLSSNYNSRLRPPEILVHGAQAQLIRPRETLDELLAQEESLLSDGS